MLVSVVISGDKNLIKKENDNFLRYTDFTIGIQRMTAHILLKTLI